MLISSKPVRRSQLISPWGVGSIVPFPQDESLIIAGLDMWSFGRNPKEFIIRDERLAKRLGVAELRRPPDFRDSNMDNENAYIKIPALRFPRWHYCPFCGTMNKLQYYSRQSLCDGYQWSHGRTCDGNRFKRKLIPERFIVICPDGHMDDFPIMEWVHKGKNISSGCKLKRSTGGMSASLTGITYECSCGAKRSMAGSLIPGVLEKMGYKCKSSKPWLGIEEDIEHPCDKPLHVVQRGGTNVWFADVRSSIYISMDDIKADRRLLSVVNEFYEKVICKRVNGELDKDFINLLADAKNVDATELYDAFMHRLNNTENENELTEEISEEQYRYSEYKVLVKSCGGDTPDFHSINHPISEYDNTIHNYFNSISLVPKLRETRAFIGFSRLQPNDGMSLKDKKNMLRLGNGNWLPAIEVYGEGIFFEFNENQLKKWVENEKVKKRIEEMNKAYINMVKKRNSVTGDLNPEYILIHTFAHLLINQLSYECGYGSSSIRERIYCNKSGDEQKMYGVLIYTASGDSEGSFGGLVRQGLPGRIEETIIAAIKNAEWCSADPICIQSPGQGPDSCNMAACHNCALLPETCCENGNRLLDRGFVVGTIDDSELKYFDF